VRVILIACVTASLLALTGNTRGQSSNAAHRAVSRQELVAAMRTQRGYNVRATTNGARFDSAVMFDLAAAAAKNDGARRPLSISRFDWLEAFIEATDTPRDAVPPGIRLSADYRQDITIEYDTNKVVKRVNGGNTPLQALAVRHAWPAEKGRPDSFTYEDRTANPPVRVTNGRVIEYRLLRFGDVVAYERMEGFQARPLSGFSAWLLRTIGDANILASRFAVDPNGIMVVRTRVRVALIPATVLTTVYPDGRMLEGLPDGNSALTALARTLEVTTDIDYQ
jgi:hypothetical protein